MQPYEFGQHVGLYLKKQAGWAEGDWIPSWSETGNAAFGTAPMTTQAVDPMQRGIVQHVAQYSNPISGVPTAINDTARHLYNGRYLSALGSVGEGALSFLPGAGGLLSGAATKGLARGGARLAGAGATTAGKALTGTANALNKGTKIVTNAQKSMGAGIQKALPTVAPAVPAATGAAGYGAALRNAPTTARNFIVTKPIQAAAGGFGPADPLTVGAIARGEHYMTPDMRAYQQQMQQPQMPAPPAPAPAPAPAPMAPKLPPGQFKPKKMLNF